MAEAEIINLAEHIAIKRAFEETCRECSAAAGTTHEIVARYFAGLCGPDECHARAEYFLLWLANEGLVILPLPSVIG